ncbi:MAG: DMT family transporter [Flavobacteriaceae bacterium]|nr:DMT family transporter [Flavobacteriaceae bacterium]
MSNAARKWVYLIILALIWGSSFILIKKSLIGLTPYQVGSLRIIFTTLFLLPFGVKGSLRIKRRDWSWIAIVAFLSSFIPPIFFALAQTEIDSAVTSIFNSLTPLNTALMGVLLFGFTVTKKQTAGVLLALFGAVVLIAAGAELRQDQNYWYVGFIITSSILYAFNINVVKKHLLHIRPLILTTASFMVIFPPAFVLLYYTGFFESIASDTAMQKALWYIAVLALFGTAFSKVLFNKMVQIASPVFASSVTYLIPIIAVIWGVLDGEQLSIWQIGGGFIILIGVFLVHRKENS